VTPNSGGGSRGRDFFDACFRPAGCNGDHLACELPVTRHSGRGYGTPISPPSAPIGGIGVKYALVHLIKPAAPRCAEATLPPAALPGARVSAPNGARLLE
jgi:hypothetical protein